MFFSQFFFIVLLTHPTMQSLFRQQALAFINLNFFWFDEMMVPAAPNVEGVAK